MAGGFTAINITLDQLANRPNLQNKIITPHRTGDKFPSFFKMFKIRIHKNHQLFKT